MALEITVPAAPPRPSKNRETASEIGVPDEAHAPEATQNKTRPASNGGRRPKRSLSGPIMSWPTPRPTRHAVSESWIDDALAWRSAVKVGSAGMYMSMQSGPKSDSVPMVTNRLTGMGSVAGASSPRRRGPRSPEGCRGASKSRLPTGPSRVPPCGTVVGPTVPGAGAGRGQGALVQFLAARSREWGAEVCNPGHGASFLSRPMALRGSGVWVIGQREGSALAVPLGLEMDDRSCARQDGEAQPALNKEQARESRGSIPRWDRRRGHRRRQDPTFRPLRLRVGHGDEYQCDGSPRIWDRRGEPPPRLLGFGASGRARPADRRHRLEACARLGRPPHRLLVRRRHDRRRAARGARLPPRGVGPWP